jgi:hypothetical protein
MRFQEDDPGGGVLFSEHACVKILGKVERRQVQIPQPPAVAESDSRSSRYELDHEGHHVLLKQDGCFGGFLCGLPEKTEGSR